MQPTIIEILQERGLIEALTAPDELKKILQNPIKLYCGFDPTGDSLHLGHMVAMMGLAWFQKYGHHPIALVGGATGMIGDPSGKSTERQLLDEAAIERNVEGIKKNLEAILENPQIVNNFDWFKSFSLISFLRDVGKHFRLGPMLSKDSVKLRMNSEEGMSFTEFCYQTLQGYDFLYLFKHHQVVLQLGGSDQWGNITAGTDLIRKVLGQQGFGMTFPLLTRSDGQKFGKSEKGAIWLSADRLSPYEFYQYLVRIPDQDVIKMMKILTFMEMDEIKRIEKQMQQEGYVPNTAQKKLAQEVTQLVHGSEKLQTALNITQAAAPGNSTILDIDVLEALAKEMESKTLPLQDIVGISAVDLMVKIGLQASKGEAKRLIKGGGAYLNNDKISDEALVISQEHLIGQKMLVLAAGKKNKMIVKVLP